MIKPTSPLNIDSEDKLSEKSQLMDMILGSMILGHGFSNQGGDAYGPLLQA